MGVAHGFASAAESLVTSNDRGSEVEENPSGGKSHRVRGKNTKLLVPTQKVISVLLRTRPPRPVAADPHPLAVHRKEDFELGRCRADLTMMSVRVTAAAGISTGTMMRTRLQLR